MAFIPNLLRGWGLMPQKNDKMEGYVIMPNNTIKLDASKFG